MTHLGIVFFAIPILFLSGLGFSYFWGSGQIAIPAMPTRVCLLSATPLIARLRGQGQCIFEQVCRARDSITIVLAVDKP